MDTPFTDGTCMACVSLKNVVARTMVRAGWFYRAWSSTSIRRSDKYQILVLAQDWCLACDIWQELVRTESTALPAYWLAYHPAILLPEAGLEQRLFQMLSPDHYVAAVAFERLLALKAME